MMALKKILILRSAQGARLEGRRAAIPGWTAGVSPAPLRPQRPRSDREACRYVDALIAALAALAICFTAWGALAQSPGNFSTLSTTGTATLNGDVLMCS